MMDKLYIKGNEEVPEIIFDADKEHFEISGRSIPENANTVFSPALNWLNQYFENPNNQTNLMIKLEYINSSSTKKIIEILLLLEKQMVKGRDIKVQWYCLNNDVSMESKARELLGLFNIPSEVTNY